MFELTLEINQKCNLKCKYCYLNEKNNSTMPLHIAIRSISQIVQKVIKEDDRKIVINFLGGEPLIDFTLIQDIVDYCGRIKGIKFKYTISTNGILLDEEMVRFFIKYSFTIKISLDGREHVNDVNRVDFKGEGSYKFVNRKIPLLNEYQKKTRKIVQVTSVFTADTIEHYSDTLEYLVNVKNFRYISTTLDTNTIWSSDEKKVIEYEIRKAFDFFLESFKRGNPFYWKNAFTYYNNLGKERERVCGAGNLFYYVACDGRIFTCGLGVARNSSIGNIQNGGIAKDRLWELYKKRRENMRNCIQCSYKVSCNSYPCLYLDTTENNLSCELFKIYRKIYYEKKAEYDQLIKNFRL